MNLVDIFPKLSDDEFGLVQNLFRLAITDNCQDEFLG